MEPLKERIKDSSIGMADREMLYYSGWHWSAVHIIVSIPHYQTIYAIAARLNLTPVFVELTLTRLEEFGLVRKEGAKWLFAGGSLHLAKTSPLNVFHHANWRTRAVQASQVTSDDGIHYTVVQSLSRDDYEKIRVLLLKTIDQYAQIAKPSKEEELFSFTCDFFRV